MWVAATSWAAQRKEWILKPLVIATSAWDQMLSIERELVNCRYKDGFEFDRTLDYMLSSRLTDKDIGDYG
jgi:hypothetical protein